jgi:plasmid stabilization system protein ParE
VPQHSWSAKRRRQYEHIRDGLEETGRSEAESEEIAARTVNKERARSGESWTSTSTSVRDISSRRRGGLRSHKGPEGRTTRQLYEEAKHQGVQGRSTMNKAQLEQAVDGQ